MKSVFLAFLLTAGSGAQLWAEQISNGGFEDLTTGPAPQALVDQMKASKWTFTNPLQVPKDWRPNPFLEQGEYRLVEEESKAHAGKRCIYLKGDMMRDKVFHAQGGDTIEFGFWAKDENEQVVLGVVYLYGIGEKDELIYLGDLSFFEPGSKEWKEHRQTLTIPATREAHVTKERMEVKRVKVAVRSPSGACFDDVSIELATK